MTADEFVPMSDQDRKLVITGQLHELGDHSWCPDGCPDRPSDDDEQIEPPEITESRASQAQALTNDREHDQQGGNDPPRRSWQAIDLGPILDGDYERPQPTVGRRSDGHGLFYPGRSHAVAAESEAGKTWLSLAASLDEINAGNDVLYFDFEDEAGAMIDRMLTIGAKRDVIAQRFHYVRPEGPVLWGDVADMLTAWKPTLAVLDGITEAMTMHGLDPLSNKDCAVFGQMLPRRIARHGPAVGSLDHVTKDRDGRGRYAIGAVHKLNGLDGAQYTLESRAPFGIGLTGRSRIRVGKDRPGQLRRHGLASTGGLYWYGDLVVDSHDEDFADVTIEPPTDHGDQGGADTWRPTTLMQRVAAALAEHGDLSQNKIELAVGGNRQNVRDALGFLVLDGYVTDQTPHHLIKPYQPDEVPK